MGAPGTSTPSSTAHWTSSVGNAFIPHWITWSVFMIVSSSAEVTSTHLVVRDPGAAGSFIEPERSRISISSAGRGFSSKVARPQLRWPASAPAEAGCPAASDQLTWKSASGREGSNASGTPASGERLVGSSSTTVVTLGLQLASTTATVRTERLVFITPPRAPVKSFLSAGARHGAPGSPLSSLPGELAVSDHLERPGGYAGQLLPARLFPSVVDLAADVPVRPVVRDEHAVLLERGQDHPGLLAERGEVEPGLQAEAEAHGREGGILIAAGVVGGRRHVGRLR